ncbi:hypothetical protein ILYODFUR_035580 [Ilyodon furcidens]|uniref:Uncharacterized protein n=1 Tax=Ilyodon furcidens TaxID=33524 RepID=A0ABV0UB19_9TELE
MSSVLGELFSVGSVCYHYVKHCVVYCQKISLLKLAKRTKKPCCQRRGRRGRIWHKLRKITFNIRCVLLALPTILLSKLQSIWNKFEKLKAWIKSTPERTKTCLLDFTEMGLGESEQDEELSLVDWTTTPTS